MRELKGRHVLDLPHSYVVVDVETTGLDPSKDRLIEVAALKITDGNVSDSFSTLINPGVEISSFITNLTGKNRVLMAYMHKSVNKSMEYTNIHK